MATPLLDVLIVGGGPAGLSLAGALARQLYTAVVFDNGTYRNARATHMHNVLGWDHQSPEAFRAKGREDILSRYETITVESTTIQQVRKIDAGFEATNDKGQTWTGRKLALATGVRDTFPDIPGFADCWGRGIFHCLYCHGYEQRGQRSVGVLMTGFITTAEKGMHMGHMARRLAGNVVLYTNGSETLADELKSALMKDKNSEDGTITVDSRAISTLRMGTQSESSVVITFSEGGEAEEGFLVNAPVTKVNSPLAEQLSLELSDGGDILTTPPFFESSVPGVFAIGDCGVQMKAVPVATYSGTMAAAGIGFQIIGEGSGL
ncbi:related to thioredoxin reductase [Cephalotrichum gorgonifer]|uniref:Related to thioredoxin reductase n=1 Tax=Cephalotrichum gorgonifer TaxID=2041049 RepID=A0AAE8SYU4_9PEZI|nr:related to thioredoxin reductase [Cephalotrichum gorgonifer]